MKITIKTNVNCMKKVVCICILKTYYFFQLTLLYANGE